MKVKNGLSSSMEDYLREIYVLTQKNDEVRVTDIAQLLGISKPSVNRAMNTLKEQGYIEHEHYGTIKLTKAGAEAGKSVYDTYKIVYKFLTDVLEVRPSDAEEEAHLLEHDISKGTRKKLKKFMKKRK
ncbi:metal-dependent transcriptional regulator [Frisingicoccus sp.]|uniref:metal-dependent transcriptional regulator n=1 Tax=Frisingicoccus sp. TaxID=1918627 RepID=UPI003AB909C1